MSMEFAGECRMLITYIFSDYYDLLNNCEGYLRIQSESSQSELIVSTLITTIVIFWYFYKHFN